nr:PoNe immunity protein domain-containing protein [uncultured Duganella sp.]
MTSFKDRRRQIYLDQESYQNTVTHLLSENSGASPPDLSPTQKSSNLELTAFVTWTIFQLRHTAGESPTELANSLDEVVLAYENWVASLDDVPEDDYYPPFVMNDMIDTYVDYLNLICFTILLRREDLLDRISALNEGSDFDRVDAVLEELLKFFLPDRPVLDFLFWKKQYEPLVHIIDLDTPQDRVKAMKGYVNKWYANMKGKAHFWSKHEQIKPEFTPYYGYWAMCAGAFTYLYDIDDAGYRDQIVYPKDLVDYARSIPRTADAQATGVTQPLRLAGGQACPRSGVWLTPAKADSRARFQRGEVLPDFPEAPYGLTIWQFMED